MFTSFAVHGEFANQMEGKAELQLQKLVADFDQPNLWGGCVLILSLFQPIIKRGAVYESEMPTARCWGFGSGGGGSDSG